MATGVTASPRRRARPARCNAARSARRRRRSRRSSRPISVFASRQLGDHASSSASGRGSMSIRSSSICLARLVAQVRGEEDVALLVGEPRRRVVGREVLPALRRPCRSPRPARARRTRAASPPPRRACPAGSSSRSGSPIASRGWRTSQTCSPSWATIPTEPGCDDPLARHLLAVLVAERALADVDDRRPRRPCAPPGARSGSSCGGHHRCRTPPRPRRAARGRRPACPPARTTPTRSVGSWLCSVPLARLTHSMPWTASALASDPPPVTIRLGS